jgi:hypothetical protein
MNGRDGSPHAASTQSHPQGEGSKRGEIDVQRLADKVYGLMLAEARLARARSADTPARVVR